MKQLNKTQMTVLLFSAALLPLNNANAANKLSDEWKEISVANRISMNDVLDSYEIETEVKNNVATLSGQVSSSVEKELASEIAKNVEGITGVENNITVNDTVAYKRSTNTFSQNVSDATTTARVKSRLLWSSGVPGMGVDVSTKNGEVTLAGEVPLASQKELAAKLAANTSGVYNVKNNIVATADKRSKMGSVDLDKVEKNAGETLDKAGDVISDTWVEAKVSASLNFSRSLNIRDLSVKTSNGAVTLTGFAYNEADKQLASEIAKDIKGVKSVQNLIKVL